MAIYGGFLYPVPGQRRKQFSARSSDLLSQEIPDMTLERIKFLDFRSEDVYPMTFLTASILDQLWISRTEKKRCTWPSIRAQVESEILLLRKGRLAHAGERVQHMLDVTPP